MRESKSIAEMLFDEEATSSQQRMGGVARAEKRGLRNGLNRRTEGLKEANRQAM
jgi:hypothetical protein